MDHVSKEVRSQIMRSVKSKGGRSTEAALGKLIRAAGMVGYRKNWRVEGKPDFAWPKRKLAVFVDGCFWHGHSCKKLPESNTAFWKSKIEANQMRDKKVSSMLRRMGWRVIRIRECKVKNPASLARIVRAHCAESRN